MNIWDSVQRGLEKATQEATRIAKTQRLRSSIDGLTRQVHTQEETLITRALEVFAAGQLTQGELIPICQELSRLQQQLEQNKQELSQLQSQSNQSTTSGQSATTNPYTRSDDLSPTVYAPPPDYRPYDATTPAPLPPPPPGVEPLTISSFDTAQGPAPIDEKQTCKQCGAQLISGNAYCHNCGTPVQSGEASSLPTTRGTEPETMRPVGDTPPTADQATIRSDPSTPQTSTNEQDGGH